MRRVKQELSGHAFDIGSIVHVENKIDYYRIVDIQQDQYVVKKIKSPYVYGYFYVLMMLKIKLNQLFKTLTFH